MPSCKGYSLWFESVKSSSLVPPSEFEVTALNFPTDRFPSTGGGAGKAEFKSILLRVLDKDGSGGRFSVLASSGMYIGRGRLFGVMPSGLSRIVLEFEGALAEHVSMNSVTRYQGEFDLKLSVTRFRFLI